MPLPIIPALTSGFAACDDPMGPTRQPGAIWQTGYEATQFDQKGHWVECHENPVGLWKVQLGRVVYTKQAEEACREVLRGCSPLLLAHANGELPAYDVLTGSSGCGFKVSSRFTNLLRGNLRSAGFTAVVLDVAISNYEVKAIVPLEEGLCKFVAHVAREEIKWG